MISLLLPRSVIVRVHAVYRGFHAGDCGYLGKGPGEVTTQDFQAIEVGLSPVDRQAFFRRTITRPTTACSFQALMEGQKLADARAHRSMTR